MDKTDFYDWQLEAFDRIEGRSAVLSAPTGSGSPVFVCIMSRILLKEMITVSKLTTGVPGASAVVVGGVVAYASREIGRASCRERV